MRANGRTLRRGDLIAIDGTSGRVTTDDVPLIEPQLDQRFRTVLKWADEFRRLGVRANADSPDEARRARDLGAEGIGLCRTEHMFMEADRLPRMRRMILARDERARRRALDQLLPLQRRDFEGIFRAMKGLPVTIRLLDPPLHEFLPKKEELVVKIDRLERGRRGGPALKRLRRDLQRLRDLEETNPMLGTRGCRLGIVFPEIYEMQVRAIVGAAVSVRNKTRSAPRVEIMIPLVDYERELEAMRRLVDETAEQTIRELRAKPIDYAVGTMIELPRACLIADKIARHADFFSFGTNDLTQTVLGFSRDDIESTFLARYIEQRILDRSPFETIDVPGVGSLVKTAVKHARGGAARHQARHLRRARRRSPERAVLRRRGPGLRELLTVPGAGRARGGRAGRDPARGLTWPEGRSLRVAVVAEYYPRPSDPALGVWAHRQALAVREHGVEVRVLALDRPLPPLGAVRGGPGRAAGVAARCASVPRSAELDGIPVRYVRFVSPPRPLSYATWGRWAARPLARALDELDARVALRRRARALRGAGGRCRAALDATGPGRPPLVVSVHGGDLSFNARRPREVAGGGGLDPARGGRGGLEQPRSRGAAIEELAGPLFRLETIHLGADIPAAPPARRDEPTLVTVGHLVPHKGQAAVIRALRGAAGPSSAAAVRGDREGTRARGARAAGGAAGRGRPGRVPRARCRTSAHWRRWRAATSTRCPARTSRSASPTSRRWLRGWSRSAAPGRARRTSPTRGRGSCSCRRATTRRSPRQIDRLVADSGERERLSQAARATVAANFTWERNGERTAALYRGLVKPHAKGATHGS